MTAPRYDDFLAGLEAALRPLGGHFHSGVSGEVVNFRGSSEFQAELVQRGGPSASSVEGEFSSVVSASEFEMHTALGEYNLMLPVFGSLTTSLLTRIDLSYGY